MPWSTATAIVIANLQKNFCFFGEKLDHIEKLLSARQGFLQTGYCTSLVSTCIPCDGGCKDQRSEQHRWLVRLNFFRGWTDEEFIYSIIRTSWYLHSTLLQNFDQKFVRMEARGNKWTIILDLRHNNFACASLHNQCTIAFAGNVSSRKYGRWEQRLASWSLKIIGNTSGYRPFSPGTHTCLEKIWRW